MERLGTSALSQSFFTTVYAQEAAFLSLVHAHMKDSNRGGNVASINPVDLKISVT